MRDLTKSIVAALEREGRWSTEDVSALSVEVQSLIPGSAVDWEVGDEAWARIHIGEEVVVLVWVRAPLVLFARRVSGSLKKLQCDVEQVEVDNMDSEELSADRAFMEKVTGRELSEHVDFSCLSANDLWWATVS